MIKKFLQNLFQMKQYPSLLSLNISSGMPAYQFASDTSLSLSAVFACVRAIADPISYLPLHLYVKEGESRNRATNHQLYYLLHDEPNPDMSALDFRHFMQQAVLLYGNAYAEIIRGNKKQIIALYPLHPQRVNVKLTDNGLEYLIDNKSFPKENLFHLKGLGDGYIGYSVLSYARKSFYLARTLEEYGIQFFENGAKVPYALSWDGQFRNPSDIQEFKENWNKLNSTVDEWHKPLFLSGGLKYQTLGIAPEDAQFLSTRKFQIAEIARWFRVPLHLLGELDRSTFSNIEHQSLEFVQHTLLYWAKNWEQAIHRQLLSPVEKRTMYAEFDFAGMLRGDYETRTKGYANLLDRGVLSVNEVRRMENLNEVPDGDIRHIPLNMTRFPASTNESS